MQRAVRPIDPDNAFSALIEASELVGLDRTGAELVRLGSNAVFRFRTAPIIGRVASTSKRLDAAKREIEVSSWLAKAGLPAVRALDIAQPVVAQGRVVTFWESAADTVEYGSTRELASLLRELHQLEAPFTLPQHDPIAKIASTLREAESIDARDLRTLTERYEQLAPTYAEIAPDLQPGVIHGDANVGNVIRDRNGVAILADLDNFSIGPREWDLVLTALYYEQFGWHTQREYGELVAGYGYDIMAWPGYPIMRDVRELLMVIWLAKKSSSDENAATELKARLTSLRTGGSRRSWRPF